MARRPLPAPLIAGSIQVPYIEETYVYRAICRCNDLLYVGITNNLFKRLQEHRISRVKWFRRMARLEWELYSFRAEAERVEAHLIATLDPLHNTLGRVHRVPRWRPLPELKPPPSREESEAAAVQRAIAAHRKLALGDRL